MIRKLSKATLAVMLSTMLVVVGCSLGDFVSLAIKDLPILVQIAESILGIVAAAQGRGQVDPAMASQIQAAADAVKSDLLLVESLVNAYKAADAANKTFTSSFNPAVAHQIDAALSAVQGNLNGLLAAAHVNNPALQATIAAAVGLAITTVLAIQALVPGGVKASASSARPISPKDLRNAFNGVVNSNGFSEFAIK